MENKTRKNPKQSACCICSIPYECGKRYAGETSTPQAILCKHRLNLRQGLHEKSKLAQHAYAESHSVGLDEA